MFKTNIRLNDNVPYVKEPIVLCSRYNQIVRVPHAFELTKKTGLRAKTAKVDATLKAWPNKTSIPNVIGACNRTKEF